MNKLTISLSPHIHSGDSINRRMWNVVIALLPALAVALWTFGLPALWVTLVSVGSCLLAEWLIARFLLHKPCTLSNGSALITGLLLAFNLPSILPLWMVAIGAIVAIGIGKMSFGGLGCNIWNPALVGRVFLLISFPAAMTTWPTGVSSAFNGFTGASTQSDADTGATLLTHLNSGDVSMADYNVLDMAIGQMNGSLGEVGAFAILIGLAYLLITRTITWHIPVSILASAALFSWAFGGNPVLDLLAGGLMLGAVFMATDYVTSPMTHSGQLLFGFMIGLITIIIRKYGAYPEGVSFAILLMNSFVPLINRYFRPAIFGEKKGGRQHEEISVNSPQHDSFSWGSNNYSRVDSWKRLHCHQRADCQTRGRATAAAIADVAPSFDNNPESDKWETTIDGNTFTVYPAYKDGKLAGAAVKGSTMNGFAGEIVVMCGFEADGTVKDYRVLRQAETPGLGTKWRHGSATRPGHALS